MERKSHAESVFPLCRNSPYSYPGASEQSKKHNCDHINHGPWERWCSLEAQECERITPEEDEEEDNEVLETMGGQRRMCVDVTGASTAALIHPHQPLPVTEPMHIRVYTCVRSACLSC